mmetsp:Transcript_21937/g.55809  ORF Transcript_21937/g.55809 Transcript_21937/m.55809 type:complete len:225 (+) Transcript_21937:49-723(+)
MMLSSRATAQVRAVDNRTKAMVPCTGRVHTAPVMASMATKAAGAPAVFGAQAPCRSRRTFKVMAGEYVGAVTSEPSWKYGVVVARFNSLVTKQLLEGAHEVFHRHGVKAENVDVAWVPGSFELPVVAKQMAASGKYNAIVCIGAVIQGATTHYDAVVSAATNGVLNAGTATGVPVVFGVLTTDNLEQALDRSGGKVGNKGGEAALTAIEMASLLAQLRKDGKAA